MVLALYLLLLTDVVNGVLSLAFPGSLSTVALLVKALIAAGLGVMCRWHALDVYLLWVLLLVCALALLFIELNGDALTLLIKTGSVILLLGLLRRCLEEVGSDQVTRYLVCAFVVLLASSVLGLMGIGYERYGGVSLGLSANGFLPAGNEMNIALVGVFWWLSDKRQCDLKRRARRVLYILCLALMVLSFSKTTILAAAVIMFHRALRSPRASLGLAIIAPVAVYALLRSAIWERWEYFYRIYADQGVLASLTGGRFSRTRSIDVEIETLFAQGGGLLMNTGGYIESDPLDLLYNFGLLGLVLYLLFLLAVWRAAGPQWVLVALVAGISVLAGHVVYSVFAAPVLVAALMATRPRVSAPAHANTHCDAEVRK